MNEVVKGKHSNLEDSLKGIKKVLIDNWINVVVFFSYLKSLPLDSLIVLMLRIFVNILEPNVVCMTEITYFNRRI